MPFSSYISSKQVSILTAGGNSQEKDVFVFNSPQTASDGSTTKPPDKRYENVFNFVAKVDPTAQATTQTQRTKRQRYICSVYGAFGYHVILF